MKVFFNQLFDYNFYCNKKLIETCSEGTDVPEKSSKLLSHILNVHHIWNARILGNKSELQLWQIHDVKDWADMHYENQRSSFDITSNATDYDMRIEYENSEGHLYTNTLQDMLFHIINHSTHHRGQILMNLKQNDKVALRLDYISFKR